MRNLQALLLIITAIFFSACGGGGSSSSSSDTATTEIIETVEKTTISGYLVDSAIQGVDYTCDDIIDTTDISGKFTCEKDSTIYFTIGGISLGSMIVSSDISIVTPAVLYGLNENNITDVRILNFIQLVQSLDDDLDTSNGIYITDDIKTKLSSYTLDISNISTTQNDIVTLIETYLGLSLVSEDDAIRYYIETLINDLDIDNVDYDVTVPIFTSSSTVSVDENQTSVITVVATDKNDIVYSLSGTDASSFAIDAVSGVLTFKIEPVYEIKSSYSIIIIATDTSSNSANQTMTININQIIEYLDEPLISEQWSIIKNDDFYKRNNIDSDAHINASGFLDTYTGKGIKIAVIDNGFDISHEDLSAGIINTYSLDTDSSDVSHDESDEYHGTAVSGIIAARENGLGIKGIASSAELILIKYNSDAMSDSEFIELFEKAEALGADIINCSWGTGFVSNSVKDKIEDLAINGRDGKGISIVFSSGNDDDDMRHDESDIEEVISVGATDKDNLRTYYSNYGHSLDIVAPGGYYLGITTLDVMGSDGGASSNEDYLLFDDTNGFTGTSASAPIISGIIALMLEKNPELTRVEIENLLKDNADKIGNITYTDDRNDYYGYGKVNLSSIINNMN